MKKVLLLAPIPPPTGGIANWTKILYESNEIKSTDILFLNTSVRWRNITNHNKLRQLFGGSMHTILIIIKMIKLIIVEKPSVVHICTSGGLAFAKDIVIIVIAKFFGVKTLLHIRMGRLPKQLLSDTKEQKLFNFAFSIVDCCLVIDKSSFNALHDKYEKSIDKIKLLPNFFNLKEINDKDGFVIDKTENINLIYVGHVIPVKGVLELFKAIKILNNDRIRLSIVGPYEKEFKEKLDLIGINDVVTYCGMLEKEEVFKLINISSALILPSYSEGFPNVVLEAMACNKAVLATNVGAIPEMLNLKTNKECGICFESESVEGIVTCLQAVLSDTRYLKIFGQNGRERIEEEYSTDMVIPRLEKIWDEL